MVIITDGGKLGTSFEQLLSLWLFFVFVPSLSRACPEPVLAKKKIVFTVVATFEYSRIAHQNKLAFFVGNNLHAYVRNYC